MNKQEIEENIAILKSMKMEYERRNRGFGVNALALAISALEKQVPKKPIEQSTDEKTHFKCICGSIQKTAYKDGYRMGAERAYCDRCGQSLDWRNKDE